MVCSWEFSPSIIHEVGVVHHAGWRDQQFPRGDQLEELLGVAVADHIIRLAVDQQHRTAHLSDQLAVGIPGTLVVWFQGLLFSPEENAF